MPDDAIHIVLFMSCYAHHALSTKMRESFYFFYCFTFSIKILYYFYVFKTASYYVALAVLELIK